MAAAADGDLTHRLESHDRDEIGRLSGSVNTAIGLLADVLRQVSLIVTSLGAASARIDDVSAAVAEATGRSSAQASVVATAAGEVSRNVRTVAGAEEMGTSIREIAQNATEASAVGAQAVDVVQSTSATVDRLGESSRTIGEVVKELSQDTARATEDITRRVEAIQGHSERAGTAIAEVSDVIIRINGFQGTIAAAVEEQTATTQEMSRNVSSAARGADRIAETIDDVAAATLTAAASVQEARTATTELGAVSGQLRTLVAGFTF